MWWLSRVTFCPISKYWWSGYEIRCMYQMYQQWQYIFYYTNIGQIIDWSYVCWIFWNGLIWFSVIRINVHEFGIFFMTNYRIFAPNFFNFNFFPSLRIFVNSVSSKVFTFTFRWSIPQISPVGQIRRPYYGVKYVTVYCTVRLRDRGHNGFLWVHPNVVINIPPVYGKISTTIQTT